MAFEFVEIAGRHFSGRELADAVGQYSGRITIALILVIVAFSVLSAWRSTGRQDAA